MLSLEHARAVFATLERGELEGFFAHVDDKVDWSILGTHPLRGRYRSKDEFRARAAGSGRAGALLRASAPLDGDWLVAELNMNLRAKSGLQYDNDYCWVMRFANGRIQEVRAYLDSALVQRLLDSNPP